MSRGGIMSESWLDAFKWKSCMVAGVFADAIDSCYW